MFGITDMSAADSCAPVMSESHTGSGHAKSPFKGVRYAIMAAIIVLTIQGWTGDFVNLFSPFPSGKPSASMGGLLSALYNASALAFYHGLEGFLLVVMSIAVLVLSFRASRARSIRVLSVLTLAAIISAAVGGTLFVLSGFQNNANSAQMGGSFIGAYVFYFLELYFTKT
jgi:heme A synthase